MAGLKPNDFFWIIEGKLAVSECIGGGGLTARKIRREEEIQWLKSQGIIRQNLPLFFQNQNQGQLQFVFH